jgi:hypothetical protein
MNLLIHPLLLPAVDRVIPHPGRLCPIVTQSLRTSRRICHHLLKRPVSSDLIARGQMSLTRSGRGSKEIRGPRLPVAVSLRSHPLDLRRSRLGHSLVLPILRNNDPCTKLLIRRAHPRPSRTLRSLLILAPSATVTRLRPHQSTRMAAQTMVP